jgi:hypothetical protein
MIGLDDIVADRDQRGNKRLFESPDEFDLAVRAAYSARLGVEAEPPSADALTLIVQRQAERVPYETLWARGS